MRASCIHHGQAAGALAKFAIDHGTRLDGERQHPSPTARWTRERRDREQMTKATAAA